MIEPATAAAEILRGSRLSLGLSQSKLARLARVSRFKISGYELGAGTLTSDEASRICEALERESIRLRNVAIPSIATITCTEAVDA